MDTGLIIVFVLVALAVLALVGWGATRGRKKRTESKREKARELRAEAAEHSTRYERERATADEKAARARRERAEAEQRAAKLEREAEERAARATKTRNESIKSQHRADKVDPDK